MSANRPFVRGGWMMMLALAASSAAAVAAPPAAEPAAEHFVQVSAQRVLMVLADESRQGAAKKAAIRAAIDQLADVPRITSFVLGKYGRTITPDRRARFACTFRDYVEGVYQSRLEGYGGQIVKVTGSTLRKPSDVVVDTLISDGKASQPVAISWRVMNGGAGWKVVDVQFNGVWLAITQQQDFVSTIDNAGGDVEALIAQLGKSAVSPETRR